MTSASPWLRSRRSSWPWAGAARSARASPPAWEWTGLGQQYANRLAHLWFLGTGRNVPAYLLFVYFMNDSTVEKTQRSQGEWETAIYVLERFLGVSAHRLKEYMLEAFFDMGQLHCLRRRPADNLQASGVAPYSSSPRSDSEGVDCPAAEGARYSEAPTGATSVMATQPEFLPRRPPALGVERNLLA
jgi:hypothetical protein